MAYKTFLQRLQEAEEIEVELDGPAEPVDAEKAPKKGKEGNTSDFGDEVHGIAEDLLDEELAEALGQGDTKEAYDAAVRAIRDLHKIVCPDCELEADKKDKKGKGKDDEDDDEDDDDKKLTEAEGPQQISDVYEFFPNNGKKAALALARRGDLFLGDEQLIDVRGHITVDDDSEFTTSISIDGSISDGTGERIDGYFDVDVVGTIGEPVASVYIEEDNELEVLAEFNIDEQDFWDEFETEFHKEFKMPFEEENPEHAKFATSVHRAYIANPTVMVTVNSSGVDVSEILDRASNEINRERMNKQK